MNGRTSAAGALMVACALLACAGGGRKRVAGGDAPTRAGAPEGEARAALARGEAALAAGRAAEAEEALGRAAALAPKDDRPLLALARARLAAADPAGALKRADAALALRESPEGRAVRGRALARLGRFDDAAADLARALEGAPGDAPSRALMVAVQANRGDRLAAAGAFAPLVARLGRSDAVLAAWRELRFVPPDPLQAEEALDRCTRAWVALLDAQPGEAMREAANGMRFAPQFHWCAAVHAEALWAARDPASAERLLRWAIAGYGAGREPLRADAKGLLAEILSLRAGAAPEAAALAREALAVRGDRAAVLAALVRACDAAGDTGCARDASARLLALPQVPAAVREVAERR